MSAFNQDKIQSETEVLIPYGEILYGPVLGNLSNQSAIRNVTEAG